MRELKTVAEFDHSISNTKSALLILDFYAAWCGPCKALEPILDEMVYKKGDKIEIVKVSVDTVPDLAERFKIRTLPTLLFFEAGTEADRHLGTCTSQFLEEKINSFLK
jgi:thioredoxin 1